MRQKTETGSTARTTHFISFHVICFIRCFKYVVTKFFSLISNPKPTDFTVFYFLGIAYSCSIGIYSYDKLAVDLGDALYYYLMKPLQSSRGHGDLAGKSDKSNFQRLLRIVSILNVQLRINENWRELQLYNFLLN